MEIALFHHQRKKGLAVPNKALADLTKILSANQLLADSKRQTLLQKMRAYSGLESSRYDSLCQRLITNLADHYQSLPETTNSFYAQAGGLLDHALNRTEAALGLFQELSLQEPAEPLSEEQRLWQYALHSAALLQGIGKLYGDYQISIYDTHGRALKAWNPLIESLTHTGGYYDYELQKEADPYFKQRLNLLLARALMPLSGFHWIANNPQVLAVWLALLQEDYRSAGTLGALLIRADAIAIQRYFNEWMLRHAGNRSVPYGRRTGAFAVNAPESIETREQMVGIEFIQWLMQSLENGLIKINKAPLFTVPGGFLMCKEMFQLFMQEHSEYKNWQALQKGLLSLGLHQQTDHGGAFTSRVEHQQQMYDGVVLSQYAIALPASLSVYHAATDSTETLSAVELIYREQHNNQLTSGAMAKLGANGQWQTIGAESAASKAGLKRGV